MEFFLKYLAQHASVENVIMVVGVWVIFSIYTKANRIYVRQKKLMMVVSQCPSVSKSVVEWLLNDRLNSKPPEKSLCDKSRCDK